MESEEGRNLPNSTEKIFQIFSSFMARITKFEELVDVGNRYLIGFQQGLEFIRRPPIDITSELVKRIVEANKTRRLSSYVEAGCLNPHDGKQNMKKSKSLVRELEYLLDDAAAVVQSNYEKLLCWQDKDADCDLITTSNREPEITDYAVLMAFMYGMIKQEYEMQERIGSSLSLKSSSGELESYCLMWSLRPFVDDEIMHKAWRLVQ